MDAGEPKGSANREAISVKDALRTSLAENTRAAYRLGWNRFAAHCREIGQDPMAATPDDVAGFLVRMASAPRSPLATTKRGEPLSLGTIRITLAAINRKFREHDRDSPANHATVSGVLRGLGRLVNERQRRVRALREHEVAAILRYCDQIGKRAAYRLIGIRNAAVIAVGFAGALRRSEICSLRFDDVVFRGEAGEGRGMFLHIRSSKTDPLGRGQRIAIPNGSSIRPVERLRSWLTLSGIDRGPAFQTMRRGGRLQGRALSPSDVPRLVKHYVRAIGLDPTKYSSHSLRAGFVTSAAVHRARLDKIMEVTRHTNANMLLRYIRQADAFEDHAGDAFL